MPFLTLLNQEAGLTIVLVSHEPEIAAFARREITIRDGLVAADVDRQVAG